MDEHVNADEIVQAADTGSKSAEQIIEMAVKYLEQEHGDAAMEYAHDFGVHDMVGAGLGRMSEDRVEEWTRELENVNSKIVEDVRNETDVSDFEGLEDSQVHHKYRVAQEATGRILRNRL